MMGFCVTHTYHLITRYDCDEACYSGNCIVQTEWAKATDIDRQVLLNESMTPKNLRDHEIKKTSYLFDGFVLTEWAKATALISRCCRMDR